MGIAMQFHPKILIYYLTQLHKLSITVDFATNSGSIATVFLLELIKVKFLKDEHQSLPNSDELPKLIQDLR